MIFKISNENFCDYYNNLVKGIEMYRNFKNMIERLIKLLYAYNKYKFNDKRIYYITLNIIINSSFIIPNIENNNYNI